MPGLLSHHISSTRKRIFAFVDRNIQGIVFQGVISLPTLGIVAEYDPFHNGHFYHITESKSIVSPDRTFIALSGCFTQRGDLSLFTPSARASMALSCGADAVFEIPACWTLRDADHYADASVGILADLGVTHLSFGAEEADASRLLTLAALLESGSPDLDARIRTALSTGLGYPAAFSAAVLDLYPDYGSVLSRPNNILAVSYLRSIMRHYAAIEPVFIRRNGDYDATGVDVSSPSATSIRLALARGDWSSVKKAVPDSVYQIIREEAFSASIVDPDALSDVLLYLSRERSGPALESLPNLSEGLECRLRNKANESVSRSALISSVSTKRYPRARVNRLCSALLLGASVDSSIPDRIPAAILLGLKKGTALRSEIPIVSKLSDFHCNEDWFRYDLLAYDLLALALHRTTGLAYRQGVVTRVN